MLTFKVFRKVADPFTYVAIGHDGPRTLVAGVLNTFPVDIPVRPGDVIGVNDVNASTIPNACTFDAIGDTNRQRAGDLADGTSGDFNFLSTDARVNVTAVVKPSNAFTLEAVKKDKKRGTARLIVSLPGPGVITVTGNGVRKYAAGAGRAEVSKLVGVTGTVKLLVRARGNKRKKLNQTGSVKLGVTVTYTPTGGDTRTQALKVKLRKLIEP
jgi:hypothetical protein